MDTGPADAWRNGLAGDLGGKNQVMTTGLWIAVLFTIVIGVGGVLYFSGFFRR